MDPKHLPRNWSKNKSFLSTAYSASVLSYKYGRFTSEYDKVPENDLRESVDFSDKKRQVHDLSENRIDAKIEDIKGEKTEEEPYSNLSEKELDKIINELEREI